MGDSIQDCLTIRKTGEQEQTKGKKKKKKKQEGEKENMAPEDIICKIKGEIIKNKNSIMTGILYVKFTLRCTVWLCFSKKKTC